MFPRSTLLLLLFCLSCLSVYTPTYAQTMQHEKEDSENSYLTQLNAQIESMRELNSIIDAFELSMIESESQSKNLIMSLKLDLLNLNNSYENLELGVQDMKRYYETYIQELNSRHIVFRNRVILIGVVSMAAIIPSCLLIGRYWR